MRSFIIVPLLFGFIEMASMNWGLDGFFAGHRMMAHPRLAWLLKLIIALCACGSIVAVLIGLLKTQGGQPVVDPVTYIFLVAHIPVALGALVWGVNVVSFKTYTAVAKLFKLAVLLAIPLSFVLYFFTPLMDRVVLSVLIVAMLLMVPGALSWGFELFGMTLLKPKFLIVRLLRLMTSCAVIFSVMVVGGIGLLLLPGLMVQWLVR